MSQNIISIDQKAKNEKQKSACKRILIEHIFRKLKVFRILSGMYRNRRKRFALRFNRIAAIYNLGLCWIVRTGSQWRLLPHDLPPWYTVYQQAQKWIEAGVYEDMVHDLRALLRPAIGKNEQSSIAIFDSCTIQSTPESGECAGYDGYKRKQGSKIHLVVDTLG